MESQTIKPIPKALRQEIESNIYSVNKYLKDVVSKMSWKQLLANCHPAERFGYAQRLYRTNELSWDDLQRISPKKI